MSTSDLPETIETTLAPINLRLNIISEFVEFIKTKLQNQEIGAELITSVTILGHKISFRVKSCEPTPSKVGENTKIHILSIDTREDMKLSETKLNIFMTDEEAKRILSDLVVEEYITEYNAIQIWKEFKHHQVDIMKAK